MIIVDRNARRRLRTMRAARALRADASAGAAPAATKSPGRKFFLANFPKILHPWSCALRLRVAARAAPPRLRRRMHVSTG